MRPIITESNNGVLTSKMAMPLKDLTSDNDASFELSRKLFLKSYLPNTNFALPQTGSTILQRESLALNNKVVIDGKRTTSQKKWIGGNRDASSVVARRKMNTTGAIINTVGPQSFVNIVDNNTARDAIIRVRSSGSRVPVKVTQKNLLPPPQEPSINPNIKYYRIVSAGLAAIGGSVINRVSSTAYGISPGVYEYTPKNLVGTAIINATPLGTCGRSYNLITISRVDGTVTTYPRYDVFGVPGPSQGPEFASLLNTLDDSVIVIVVTYDEPQTNSNIIQTAMRRCGASSNFASVLRYRSAYILVGIPGIGVNNGLQKYVGAFGGSGDPNAWIDLRISVLNGEYTYISG